MKGYTPPPRFTLPTEPLPITRSITITEGTSVKDLAEKLEIRAKDLIAGLLAKGVFATINQTLEADLASEMARFFGADTNVISYEDQAAKEMEAELDTTESTGGEITRSPVVTIMGHVDHGKTTLLDAIRATNVAEGEAGGITQHIGAYKVKVVDPQSPAFGREIVFLDTPGHQAFTRMRARGAKVTDIVVLVVAADDGVMPQTLEAIDHANAAEVPIIVAVNKIDKPDAMPDRVKKQLADRGLMPEDWGGTTVFVDVSAKKKTNLNLMMELICLTADLRELKAVPTRPASGVVLEAKLDRGRGPVATVLVQNGTLRAADNFVVGNVFGKVRAMYDDRGRQLDLAGPSTPVEIIGLESLPQAGDQFVGVADRDKARNISEYREQRARELALAQSSRVSLEGLADQIKTASLKELAVILKGDMQGSVEVLKDMLSKIATDKVRLKLIHGGVGAITETDVLLASASNAIIIGFNVRPERKAQELADQEKVDIRLHSIIYELQDEIKRAMSGLLEPTFKETYLGRAEVRNVFKVPKAGTIAGCFVQDGLVRRDAEVRGQVVFAIEEGIGACELEGLAAVRVDLDGDPTCFGKPGELHGQVRIAQENRIAHDLKVVVTAVVVGRRLFPHPERAGAEPTDERREPRRDGGEIGRSERGRVSQHLEAVDHVGHLQRIDDPLFAAGRRTLGNRLRIVEVGVHLRGRCLAFASARLSQVRKIRAISRRSALPSTRTRPLDPTPSRARSFSQREPMAAAAAFAESRRSDPSCACALHARPGPGRAAATP